MVTKTFFRISVSSIIYQAITIVFFGFGIFFSILAINYLISTKDTTKTGFVVFLIVALLSGTFASLYIETTFIIGNIKLEGKQVANYGDRRMKREKIQYPAFAKYEEIRGLTIVSLGTASNGGKANLIRPIPFLVLELKNGKKARFALHFMSSRTVRKLLIELDFRCKSLNNQICLNIEELMKDFAKAKFANN